jgi:hypothetical protein
LGIRSCSAAFLILGAISERKRHGDFGDFWFKEKYPWTNKRKTEAEVFPGVQVMLFLQHISSFPVNETYSLGVDFR